VTLKRFVLLLEFKHNGASSVTITRYLLIFFIHLSLPNLSRSQATVTIISNLRTLHLCWSLVVENITNYMETC